jgi:hypothetical protein
VLRGLTREVCPRGSGRANYTLKPSRPGFGPAAEPPGPNITRSASRWLQICCCADANTHVSSRRAAGLIAARALAAQLSVRAVRLALIHRARGSCRRQPRLSQASNLWRLRRSLKRC